MLEILRDPHRALTSGETRRHLESVGRVVIDGQLFCSEDPDAYVPRPGDRVVVYGFRDPPGRKDLVSGGAVLAIQDDHVVPPKSISARPVDLRELREPTKVRR